MPELPEVEITRRAIEPFLLQRRIHSVETTPPSYFFLTPPEALHTHLPGRCCLEVIRIGKYLMAPLDDGWSLHLHLGMTGQVLSGRVPGMLPPSRACAPRPSTSALRELRPDRHSHLLIHFADAGPSLMVRDVRKFGKCALRPPGQLEPRHARLGPDALDIRADELYEATRRRKVDIKTLLLDQSVLAGVGNIYADEALFLAGLRPTRSAAKLTLRQCSSLVAALRRVLAEAIARGGSSISDFVHLDGSGGGFQRCHSVYGRSGQPCRSCGVLIRRLVTGGRSAHFCPRCQH